MKKISGHYLLLIAVLMVFIMIPDASALFGSKEYNEATKTVTIYDWLGLDKVADVKLDTPQIFYVMPGKDRKVAQFTVNLDNNKYTDFIDKMEFYSNWNGKEISKEISYKYQTYEDYLADVPDKYKEVCERTSNGTDVCHQEVDTWKQETKQREKWIPIEKIDLTKGNITLGLFADVLPEDNVEWIPTLAGVKIEEWATWTASFNVGLRAYYTLNETTGGLVDMVTGAYNMTQVGTVPSVEGKIGTSRGTYSTSNYFTNSTAKTACDVDAGNFTIGLWVNGTGADTFIFGNIYYVNPANEQGWVFSIYTENNMAFRTWKYPNVDYNIYGACPDKTWHYVTGRRAANNVSLFVDGVIKASITVLATANFTNNYSSIDTGGCLVGRQRDKAYNGLIDEAAVWNRALSDSEIADLATAITYNPLLNFLEVNLMSPVNYYNSSSKTVAFSCNATDETAVTNLTLIIDGIDNETVTGPSLSLNLSTSKSMSEGLHNWTCRGTDGTGVVDPVTATLRWLTVDSVAPTVNIDYPIAGNYNYNVSEINYTASDTHNESCWYTIDAGVTNSTPAIFDANFTDVESVEGSNTWIVYCNDTFGNRGSDSVTFLKDTVYPLISYGTKTAADGAFRIEDFIYVNTTWTELNFENITFQLSGEASVTSALAVYDNNFTGLADNLYWYNVTICDVANNCNITASRNITLDHVAPETVLIRFPAANDIIVYDAAGYDFNVSIYDSSEAYGTCEYNLDFGGWTSITCGDNLTGEAWIIGDHYIEFNVSDAAGNKNYNTTNFTIFKFLGYNYNENVVETSTQTFREEINTSSTVTVSPVFVYNHTQYTTGITSSGSPWNAKYNVSISIPYMLNRNQNVSFNWDFNLTYNGRTENFNDTFNQHNVSRFEIEECNMGTLTTRALNFSFIDETALTAINATIDTSLWTYYIANSALTKTYTFINLTHMMEHNFCIYPIYASINSSVSLKYSHTEVTTYPQRTYGQTLITLNNVTQNIPLYLLSSTSGQYVSFQVLSSGYAPISGVEIKVERLFGATYTELTSGTTDASGISTFWLNPNYQHRFTFTKTGYVTSQQVITPTQTQYTVILTPFGSTTNVTDTTSGISMTILPANYNLLNNTDYKFNVSLVSTVSNVTAWGFKITNGSAEFGSNSSVLNGGNLSLFLNTGLNKTFVLTVNYTINNATASFTKTYYITSGAYPVSIAQLASDAKAYLDTGIFGLRTGSFGVQLLIYVLIFITIGIICYNFQLYSPLAVSGLLLGLVFTFDFALGLITSPVGAVAHFPTIFVAIIFIAAIIKEATGY